MFNLIRNLKYKRIHSKRKKAKGHCGLKIVYVASKLAGNIDENISDTKKYCRFVYNKGFMPVASHIMYPAMGFDDNNEDERNKCCTYGLYLLSFCDELHCFIVDELSGGMKQEIKVAKKLRIPIKYFRVSEDIIYECSSPRCD